MREATSLIVTAFKSAGPHVLLAAYPARVRRRHGDEMMGTLAETAGGRPSFADHLQLLGDGLRERFRLPRRQPVAVLTAVAAMLVGGAVGLLGGSWAGLQAHPSVPAVAPLIPEILGPAAEPTQVTHERFALSIAAPLDLPVAAIRSRLADAGWQVGALQAYRGQSSFRARSGDLQIEVGDHDRTVQVMGYPVRPAGYLPLVLGGLALGLLTGWLAGAALAHRMAASRHQVPATVVGAIGAALLLVPTGRLYQGLYLHVDDDRGYGTGKLVHDALAWIPAPLRDPSAFPDTITPGVRLLAIGLAFVALAAVLARRRPTDGGVTVESRVA